MEIISNYEMLSDKINQLNRPVVVGIEGFSGSGKSSLADALAKKLNALLINTDKYVSGKDESLSYQNRLNYNLIKSTITNVIVEPSIVIFEGICLRETLRRLGTTANFMVYVKHVAENGLWHDGFHLEDYQTDVKIFENCKEPNRSDFIYHLKEHPQEQANIVFHRVD